MRSGETSSACIEIDTSSAIDDGGPLTRDLGLVGRPGEGEDQAGQGQQLHRGGERADATRALGATDESRSRLVKRTAYFERRRWKAT